MSLLNAVEDTNAKRQKVINIIKETVDSIKTKKYKLTSEISKDLTPGSIECIDTGSTGRNTNVPFDGDFDFYLRLDAEIMRNPEALEEFKDRLKSNFSKYPMDTDPVVTKMGDLRFKGVHIDEDNTLDIDLSFGVKTKKVSYSSDLCLKDRLKTIKEKYPEQYKYVVANIILAKKVLKKIRAYKPSRTDSTQGGMGGIGVENWILQNGGSFLDAARSFLEAAKGKSFEEFKKTYQIWDFGENHFAAREGTYLHDNFIADNMNKTGYEKMVEGLEKYVKNQTKTVQSLAKESSEEQRDVMFLDGIERDQERQRIGITKNKEEKY